MDLKSIRKEKGMTQKEVAEALGIKPNTVSAWEKGRNGISPEYKERLADLFGVTAEDIETPQERNATTYSTKEISYYFEQVNELCNSIQSIDVIHKNSGTNESLAYIAARLIGFLRNMTELAANSVINASLGKEDFINDMGMQFSERAAEMWVKTYLHELMIMIYAYLDKPSEYASFYAEIMDAVKQDIDEYREAVKDLTSFPKGGDDT